MTRLSFLQIVGDWSRGEGALYLRLAGAIRAAIERGDLAAGARLPAQRVLARWLDVSRTTVVMAYATLTRQEWIESRQGSGTVVRRSPARAIAARGTAAVLSGRNVVFRGLVERTGAEIEFLGAHFDGLPEVFDQAWKEARADLAGLLRGHGYMPLGLPDLRAAIAQHLERAGLPTRAEQVLVTSGAQQAIMLISNLLVEPGDAVVLEDPTYLGAIDAFASSGARLVGVPFGPDGLGIEALREAVTRTSPRVVYLIPTCHNPTGDVLDESARRAAVRALEGSGPVVVEDMTLADLTLGPAAPPPLAAFARDATVLTVGSLSKLFWGGLRVGWIRGPEPLIVRLSRLKVVSDLSGSLVSQAVAARVLRRAKELGSLRRRQARTHLEHAARLLAKHLPDWTYRRPAGGLSLWLRVPGGRASELAAIALRRGVAIVPGTVNSPEGRWGDHLRLPFVAEPARMEEGIRRIAAAWAEYAPEQRSRRGAVGVLV